MPKPSRYSLPNLLRLGYSLGFFHLISGCTQIQGAPLPTPSPNLSPVAIPSPSPSPSPLLVSPQMPEVNTSEKVQDYLQKLKTLGFAAKPQGIWIQAGETLLANEQGTTPLSAASLTKVATTLVALQTLGIDHQYITTIYITGEVKKGVLTGDLIVQGEGDPLFIWEEAIALGNTLNQLGIKRITGDLLINGKFFMNYGSSSLESGELFREAINADTWSRDAEFAYANLPNKIPKPLVAIGGNLKTTATIPANARLVLRHYSPPLTELVKEMNKYSNNDMAEMIADSVGGAKVVAQKSALAVGVPETEIQLENGSGLSEKNRISPRAAVGLFLALEKFMKEQNLTIADTLSVVGQDPGILDIRPLPPLAVAKSGTLNSVSALAGALPTEKYGIVWFAILNSGEDIENLRKGQENLLANLLKDWKLAKVAPPTLTSSITRKNKTSRNEIFN